MKEKLFFSGLNELRAFAALGVLLHHIELYRHDLSQKSLYDVGFFEPFISHLGKNGVYLFFVLSGFLITYLLLEEKSIAGRISITGFYKRRILRIWPLYFIILLIGFFFIPFIYHHFTGFFAGQDSWNALVENVTYGKNLWLFVFFLSNIALRIYGPVVGASQSWSVSIEEQFYLIWPWIVKFFHKSLIYVLIGIVIVMTVLNYNMERFDSHIARAVIYSFNIDFMAMGGIIAVLYRNNKVLARKLMTNKIVKIVILAATALHLFLPVSHFTLSLTFGLLILLLIENKVSIGMFSALGKWSYGIYMYHPLVVYFSFALLTQLGITSGAGSILGQYVLITGGTIGISYFSYQYIELFFLKLKRRFSPIVSGSL